MLLKLIQTLLAFLLLIFTTITTNSPIHVKEIEEQIAILTNEEKTLGVKDGHYKITDIVDGDTIKVEIDNKIETIRLLGIDTPEVVDPRRGVECFGREASNYAKELLSGKSVRLESDDTQSNRDRYGRLLRYVFLEDGTNVNKKLIEEGYAQEYTYDKEYKYQGSYKEAEKSARSQSRGLWNNTICSR